MPVSGDDEDWRAGGFALYLHWPFCAAKCPYCDFNSHVATRVDVGRWRRAMLAEIDRVAALTPGRRLGSVFFGGGTPSLMPPALAGDLLERIAARWVLEDDAEITLEANPTSAEAARFRAFRAAGVNRISVGIQSLEDAALRRLGRQHSAREALEAFSMARAIFPRASLDLIYARQDQRPEDWARELAASLALGSDHLSLYQLTIEEGTVFGRRAAAGALPGLPDEDRAAELWSLTQEMTRAAGLPGYEISNHALPGDESRHNLVYWRYGDYAGVGPGAHGRLSLGGQRVACLALADPSAWLRAVEEQGSGEVPREPLPREEQGLECLMMGLRLAEGVDTARITALGGPSLDIARVEEMIGAGFVWRDPAGRVGLTDAGRPLLDSILRWLI